MIYWIHIFGFFEGVFVWTLPIFFRCFFLRCFFGAFGASNGENDGQLRDTFAIVPAVKPGTLVVYINFPDSSG
jgi:hypothetical protein